jgi:arylsulfatase A-like enzyme
MLSLSLLLLGLIAGHASPPNIVVLFIDDMGYGDLPAYGNQLIKTPNIDALAAEGMKFTSWYSAAAICTPSRAALLTGRLPLRSGITDTIFQVFGTNMQNGGMPAEELTLAEALKSAGYHTGMAGKWHLGVNKVDRFDMAHMPFRHGFDHSGLVNPLGNSGVCLSANLTTRAQFCYMQRNDKITQMPWNTDHLSDRMAREFEQFLIAAPEDKPYFWYHSFVGVHTPLFASPAFQGRSAGGAYGYMVEELDYEVGLLMSHIKAHDDNTIVFLTSDNGPYLEDFVTRNIDQTSAGPFKGGKGTTWEGGFRVPGIVWWPGHVEAGAVHDQIISTMDIFPTACALAGVELPANLVLDGKDQSNLLLSHLGGHNQNPWQNTVYPFYCGARLMAVRWKKFKMHYATQLFINAAGQPTNASQCHGECCPYAPTDPFGVCGCSDKKIAISATLNYTISDAVRTTLHGDPLLFDLNKDPHESKPLNRANFEAYDSTVATIQGLVDQFLSGVVAGTPQMLPLSPVTLANPNMQPICRIPTSPFVSFSCDYELPYFPPSTVSIRGQQYCDIFIGEMVTYDPAQTEGFSGPYLKLKTYDTYPLNHCPDDRWTAATLQQIGANAVASGITLANPPIIVKSGPLIVEFDGIYPDGPDSVPGPSYPLIASDFQFLFAANILFPATPANMAIFQSGNFPRYVEFPVFRDFGWIYSANTKGWFLKDANTNPPTYYAMQTFLKSTGLSLATLDFVGAHLTFPNANWSFIPAQIRHEFHNALTETSLGNAATALIDSIGCAYNKLPEGAFELLTS